MRSERLWTLVQEVLVAPTATDATQYYECRRCGTSLGSEEEPCPYCGNVGVVEYELK